MERWKGANSSDPASHLMMASAGVFAPAAPEGGIALDTSAPTPGVGKLDTCAAPERGVVTDAAVPTLDAGERIASSDPKVVYDFCFRCLAGESEEMPLLHCNQCRRSFHADCVDGKAGRGVNGSGWRCGNCTRGDWKCIKCGEVAPVVDAKTWLSERDDADDFDDTYSSRCVLKCTVPGCLVHCHPKCVRGGAEQAAAEAARGGFRCSGHRCLSCDNKRSGIVRRCLFCTEAFHNYCGKANSALFLQSDRFLVCRRHRAQYESLAPDDDSDDAEDGDFREIRVFPDTLDTPWPDKEERESAAAIAPEPPAETAAAEIDRMLSVDKIKPGHWRCPAGSSNFVLPTKIKVTVERMLERERSRPPPLPKFHRIARNRYVHFKRPKSRVAETCHCVKADDEKLPCAGSCVNRATSVECSLSLHTCANQRLTRRQWSKHVIKWTGTRGFGMYAKEDIKTDDLIIEYCGEIIDQTECDRRMREMCASGAKNFYFLEVSPTMVIDATEYASNGRFMNHCCDPNCVAQKWHVNGVPRIGLYAKHDIAAGTELTWNYNFATVGNKVQKCMCGASNCSGVFGTPPIKQPKRKRHRFEEAIEFFDIKDAAKYVRRFKRGKAFPTKTDAATARDSFLFLPRNCQKVYSAMAEIYAAGKEALDKELVAAGVLA